MCFSRGLFALDIIIPDVNIPAGCYPGGKFIYHMNGVVQITGLQQDQFYYIKRDDNMDFTPYLSYLELLYDSGGLIVNNSDFVAVGGTTWEGIKYRYVGTSTTAYFNYIFEIENSSLINVGAYTNRPTIRIRKLTSVTAVRKSSTITIVNGSSIAGQTLLCSNSASFNLVDQPYGSSVNWQINQNGTLKAQGSGANAQASNLSNGSGNVTFNIGFDCGSSSTITSSNFWIGSPIPQITGPTEGNVNSSYTFYAHPPDYSDIFPDSYSWTLSPSYNNSIYGYGSTANAAFYSEGSFQVAVNAENNCGTGLGTAYISIYNYYGYEYSISPNPASDEITISKRKLSTSILTNENDISEDATTNYSVHIVDLYGSAYLSTKRSGDSFTIPISNLKDGEYFIQIFDGKNVFNRQFIVKH